MIMKGWVVVGCSLSELGVVWVWYEVYYEEFFGVVNWNFL